VAVGAGSGLAGEIVGNLGGGVGGWGGLDADDGRGFEEREGVRRGSGGAEIELEQSVGRCVGAMERENVSRVVRQGIEGGGEAVSGAEDG